ncbi:hypothetical protein R7040_18215 [Vibrio sp. 1069]|uniref:hypothetical protein n=1 Tax=unclassified Vibrio TaxID=2614977 RepID=UPI002964BE7E|nr:MULTISPECIES: hypothetical protein [unclassified Vibrio]MDW1763135.1 hypothetical protein [Vibrio sp. Vb2135]MDW2333029.1 hypothetical protein [Vibrio sp. 1069]
MSLTIVNADEDFDVTELLNSYSQEEVNQALNEDLIRRMTAARKAAYKAESDPLYMEWQYDQAPESEAAWRDKVAEIKARYPLPS